MNYDSLTKSDWEDIISALECHESEGGYDHSDIIEKIKLILNEPFGKTGELGE